MKTIDEKISFYLFLKFNLTNIKNKWNKINIFKFNKRKK